MIDAETERMMTNWARWRSGASIHVAVSAAYQLEERSPWAEAPLPNIDGEACDVDAAVDALSEQLRAVIEEYWIKSEPIPKKAERCGCSRATFWRRLEQAHSQIHAHRRAKQEQSKRRRAALSNPRTE